MSGERVKMGIMGLDDMLGGGLIPGSICSIIGTYGTGKTIFSLEFAWDGLTKGENVIYISLEEREERIVSYMQQKGWDVKTVPEQIALRDQLDPTDFNLANNRIKNELENLSRRLRRTGLLSIPSRCLRISLLRISSGARRCSVSLRDSGTKNAQS